MNLTSEYASIDRESRAPAAAEPESKIKKLFFDNYDLIVAKSAKQKQLAYEVRYKVYCEEKRFERASCYPSKLEIDEFDAHSEHFIVVEKYTGNAVGTVRLVFPQCTSGAGLPLHRYCLHALDSGKEAFDGLAINQFVEISRLAVISSNRSSLRDTLSCEDMKRKLARMQCSVVSIVLAYACLARFQLDGNLRCGYSMMEPKMAILLGRMGVKFERIGKMVDYHGLRAPYLYDILAQEPDEDVTHADLLMRVRSALRGQLGGLRLVE